MMNKFIFLVILIVAINCKSTVLPKTIKCNSENARNEATEVEDSAEMTTERIIIDDDDYDETPEDDNEMIIESLIILDGDDDETTEVKDSTALTTEEPEENYWNCSNLSKGFIKCELWKLEASYPIFEKKEPSKTPIPNLSEVFVKKWINKIEGSLSEWLTRMEKTVFVDEITK